MTGEIGKKSNVIQNNGVQDTSEARSGNQKFPVGSTIANNKNKTNALGVITAIFTQSIPFLGEVIRNSSLSKKDSIQFKPLESFLSALKGVYDQGKKVVTDLVESGTSVVEHLASGIVKSAKEFFGLGGGCDNMAKSSFDKGAELLLGFGGAGQNVEFQSQSADIGSYPFSVLPEFGEVTVPEASLKYCVSLGEGSICGSVGFDYQGMSKTSNKPDSDSGKETNNQEVGARIYITVQKVSEEAEVEAGADVGSGAPKSTKNDRGIPEIGSKPATAKEVADSADSKVERESQAVGVEKNVGNALKVTDDSAEGRVSKSRRVNTKKKSTLLTESNNFINFFRNVIPDAQYDMFVIAKHINDQLAGLGGILAFLTKSRNEQAMLIKNNLEQHAKTEESTNYGGSHKGNSREDTEDGQEGNPQELA